MKHTIPFICHSPAMVELAESHRANVPHRAFAAHFADRWMGQLCWNSSRIPFRAHLRRHWYRENGLQGLSFDLEIHNRWGVSPRGEAERPKAKTQRQGSPARGKR